MTTEKQEHLLLGGRHLVDALALRVLDDLVQHAAKVDQILSLFFVDDPRAFIQVVRKEWLHRVQIQE